MKQNIILHYSRILYYFTSTFLTQISVLPIYSVLGRISGFSGLGFGWDVTKINWGNIFTFQVTGTDV